MTSLSDIPLSLSSDFRGAHSLEEDETCMASSESFSGDVSGGSLFSVIVLVESMENTSLFCLMNWRREKKEEKSFLSQNTRSL